MELAMMVAELKAALVASTFTLMGLTLILGDLIDRPAIREHLTDEELESYRKIVEEMKKTTGMKEAGL